MLVVWEPILRLDSEQTARRATRLFPDPRAHQFWAPDLRVGEMFQQPLGLTAEPAWDVYLLYPSGARWEEGATAPEPRDFMHQLAGRLPEPRRLDGDALAEKIQTLLGRPESP